MSLGRIGPTLSRGSTGDYESITYAHKKNASQETITLRNEMLWSEPPSVNANETASRLNSSLLFTANNSTACRIGVDGWKIESLIVTLAKPAKMQGGNT